MDLNACLDSRIWLSSCNQKQYGCHRPRMPHKSYSNSLTERICVYCNRRRPASLEELAVIVLVRNTALLKTPDFAQTHHPQRIYWIVGRAINANLHCETAELAELMPNGYEPSLSLFDVDPDKEIILKRFLFFSSVYHKLRTQLESPTDTINVIVSYLKDFDNDYNEFWQIMKSAMQNAESNSRDSPRKSGFRFFVTSVVKKLLPWIDNEILNLALSSAGRPRAGFRTLVTSVVKRFLPWTDNEVLNLVLSNSGWPSTDGRSVEICVKIPELMKRYYKPGINCGGRDYAAMKELQRLQKRALACPIVFQTMAIANPAFPPQDGLHILQDIDPKWISYVALTASSPWSVANIDELGRVLSACENLSSIFLRQLSNTEASEDMASAVATLLGHHPQLQMIGLGGFPLGDQMALYPLPPVAELGLYDCGLTDADWEVMASRSDFALRELSVSSTLPQPPSPSLYAFILKQALSLESLALQYLTLMPNNICNLMTSIATFSHLQEFHVNYSHLDLVSMLSILLAFMTIASAEKLVFEVPDEMPNIDMMINYLLTQMKTFCTTNRRLPVCLALIDHPTQLEEKEVTTVWHN